MYSLIVYVLMYLPLPEELFGGGSTSPRSKEIGNSDSSGCSIVAGGLELAARSRRGSSKSVLSPDPWSCRFSIIMRTG